jgi:colicin import membrane protein
MKTLTSAILAAVVLAAPVAGLAQKTSTLPVTEAEGYEESNKLNQAIIERNRAAAAKEAADLAAYRAQLAAADQAAREAKARYDAQVRADAEKAARDKAAFDAEVARADAAYAAQRAAWEARDRELQAEAARARAAQEAYQRDLADYNACIAGDRKRCK